MSNLEKSFVIICVDRDFSSDSFINANTLQNDIINFNHLPSNDDIQHTFKALEDCQVISYIDFFSFVHKVSFFDQHPFKYQFFNRIAQPFLFLRILTISNQSLQSQSNENRFNLPMIDDTHRIALNVHISYDHDLERVTNSFTRDTIRIDCTKIIYLDSLEQWNVSSHFSDYSSLLEK